MTPDCVTSHDTKETERKESAFQLYLLNIKASFLLISNFLLISKLSDETCSKSVFPTIGLFFISEMCGVVTENHYHSS